MAHIVLLGDSIFDNAPYVADGLPVIDQVRQELDAGGDWAPPMLRKRASLLAVDGDCIEDVREQLKRMPADATHLFISVGGNDALGYGAILQETATSLPVVLNELVSMKTAFSQNYRGMLAAVLALGKPTTVCTIYDQVPTSDPVMAMLAFTALSMFNDCITRQAVELGLPLIDLRLVCSEASDYSSISPIEPSTTGGAKIARCIATVLKQHDFSSSRTVCYA